MDNTSPTYNDELGMPPVQQFTPDHSKRNKTIIIVVIILLLGGGLLWWFVLRGKPTTHTAASKTNSSQQQLQTTVGSTPHAIYLKLSKQAVGNDLIRLDADTEETKTITSADDYIADQVELPDGTMRSLSSHSASDGDNSKLDLVIRDNNKQPKTIYTTTSNSETSRTIWPGALSAEGSRAYFYEANLTAQTQRIAYVDISSGAVTDVITYKDSDGKTGMGQFKGVITPNAVSKDGNTIYFNVHSCLNCDGPSYGDVVAYNVPSKAFTTLFVSTDQGQWQKLSNDYFAIQTNSLNTNFILPSYEDTTSKDTEHLYLFDVKAGKAISIVSTGGSDFYGRSLGLSADSKTFYYYTDKIVKENTPMTDGPGHTYHFETNEIIAYSIADGKATKLSLPLDPISDTPLFLTSNGTAYIYGTSGRYKPFSDHQSTEDFTVYRSQMDDTKQKKTLASYPNTETTGMNYAGYAAKQ